MIEVHMMKNARFTKILAVTLAVILLRTSVAGAVSLMPGSLAVLEPPINGPEMRAAWDGIRSEVYLDPLLLVRGREDVLRELEEWRQAALAVQSAHRTADRVTLDRARNLLDQAWSSYYRFDYGQASTALEKARQLLLTPGAGGFRVRLMFEVHLLLGIVARAAGDREYIEEFKRAAAVDPHRELPLEKYSPQIINIYNSLKTELLAETHVSLVVDGTPHDASISLGGKVLGESDQDNGYSVLPGTYFVEVSAPGYEPWSRVVEMNRFEPAHVSFELVPNGPEGDVDSFFLQRLRVGDRPFMSLLAEKLEVDYLLIPDPEGNTLKVWLVDREGRTVDHVALWETGEKWETGAQRVSKVLDPLRQEWSEGPPAAGAPYSLPSLAPSLRDEVEAVERPGRWSKYAIAIGVILLVAAASAERSGSTRIEAAW